MKRLTAKQIEELRERFRPKAIAMHIHFVCANWNNPAALYGVTFPQPVKEQKHDT